MKINKRGTAILLALLLMLSLCGCAFYPAPDRVSSLQEHDFRGDIVQFSEMKYVRPDVRKMQSLADEISHLLSRLFTRAELIEKLDDFYELYYNFYTMQEIAGIRSDIDTKNKYYSEEYSFCTSKDAEVDRILDELLCDCANSHMYSYLDSQYFDGYLSEHYSYDGNFSYTDKLVGLYTKESSIISEYRELVSEMAGYDGEDVYEKYNERACNIYIDLIKTRRAIAKELGYSSYEDYMFYSYGRDYSVTELESYLAAVKKYIVPLYKKAYNKGLMNEMYDGLKALSTDEALKCFDGFVSKLPQQIRTACDFMKDYGLYSVSDNDSDSETSYTTYLDNYDAPFMLVQTDGYAEDMLTLVHEFGHYCDDYINYDKNNRLDTTELMSQGLEYMLLCYLDDAELRSSLTDYKMLDELFLYVNQAGFYDFEHRVFRLPDAELTPKNINSLFSEVAKEYGFGTVSSTDLSWIEINHFFDYPFYVISYCVSDSAAFLLYNMELSSPGAGMDMYIKLLNDAENYDFKELLEKEGMPSPISGESIKETAEVLQERLGL